MDSRFGIDLNSLTAIVRSGVTSKAKVNEICGHLHTSPEGLPSFPAHISLRQNTYGQNTLSSLTINRQGYLSLLKKSLSDFEPRFIRNFAIVLFTLQVVGSIPIWLLILATSGDSSESDPAGIEKRYWVYLVFCLEILGTISEVVLAIIVEATLNYRKQGKLEEFLKRLINAQKPEVKRDGNILPVGLEDVVVGDICHLKAGDVVPADGLLLESKDVKFDSQVTSNEGLFCSAGSLVSEGTGTIVVVAVGPNTQINYLVNEPLPEKKLFNSTFILYVAIALGTAVFLLPVTRFVINTYVIDDNEWNLAHLRRMTTFLAVGLKTIVFIIPWFLPLAIVLSIHYAQKVPGPLSISFVKATALSNVLKFLQFTLTVNILIVVPYFMVAFAYNSSSLVFSAAQTTWICLSTYSLAIVLFPSDSPKLEESNEEEAESSNKLAECVKNVFGQLVLQVTILVFLLFFGGRILDLDEPSDEPSTVQTMSFNTAALMSFCNLYNSRKLRDERDRRERNICSGIFNRPKTLVLFILILILQVVIVQTGGLAFNAHPLNLQHWLTCIFLGLSVLIWGQLLMCINAGKLVSCCCCKESTDQIGSRAAIYAESANVTAV